MVDYIHREFLQILNEVDWMDEDTRQRGIEKGKLLKSPSAFAVSLIFHEISAHLPQKRTQSLHTSAIRMSC